MSEARHLLRESAFRHYWIAASVSLTGDAVAVVALPLTAITELDAGPQALGTLTALAWLPSLLFGVPAGALVDRRRRPRLVMLTADCARALLLLTVPAAAVLGVLTLPQLYVVTFGIGALSVPADTATARLFVQLVPPVRSVAGAQLVNGARAGAGVLGQACGGSLVALLTAPVALTVDVVSYLGSALALRRVPDPLTQRRDHGRADGARPVRDGLLLLLRTPPVRLLLAASVTLNVFTTMSSAMVALFATRVLGLGPGPLGAALAVGATGGVLGALAAGEVAARLGVGRALALGTVLFPAPFGLLALSPSRGDVAWIALALAEVVASVGVLLFDVASGAVRACAVPADAQARVSGAFQTVNFGVRPFGALFGGALGEAAGLRAVLVVAALGGVLSVLWVLPRALWTFRVPVASARDSLSRAEGPHLRDAAAPAQPLPAPAGPGPSRAARVPG